KCVALHVFHHAGDVPFGVGKLDDLPDVRNVGYRAADRAGLGLDRGNAVGDRTHGDRAAKAVERALCRRAATLRHQPVLEPGIGVGSGGNEVEVRPTPDLEGPAEHALVEFAGSFDIAREDFEVD